MGFDTMRSGVGYDMSVPSVPSGRMSGDSDTGRQSVEWYQSLVQYYLDRRQKYQPFWDFVDVNYRHKSLEEKSDFLQIREIFPGRVYSLVHTIESMVAHDNPKFYLRGYQGVMEEEVVPAMEDLLNDEWMEDTVLDREMRLCVRDCIKYGRGVMLTSYEADPDYDPDAAAKEAAEQRAQAASDPMMAQAEAELTGELAAAIAEAAPEEEEETYEQDSRVLRENISSRRIPLRNFLMDPDATGVEDAKWMGRCVLADYEAVLADPSFKNKAGLQPTTTERINYFYEGDSHTNPYKMVALYEIFERQPGGGWRMIVMADGHKKFLRSKKNLYWVGNPYDLLSWNDDGVECFPQSDILPVMSEILGERVLMSKVIEAYARQANDTVYVAGDAGMNEEDLKAPRTPGASKYIRCAGTTGVPLAGKFHKIPNDQLSQDALNLLAMLERGIQVGSGIGPNQSGMAMKSETSATEASEVAGFSRARGAHKYRAVEKFVAAIAQKRLGLMAEFYRDKPERIAYIAGKDAAIAWAKMKWTRGDVQANLRVNVEPGSMKPINDDTRLQQIISWMGLAMQNPVLATATNWPKLVARAARPMGFKKGDSLLIDQDPEKVSQAMGLMSLLESGGSGSGSPPAAQNSPSGAGQTAQSLEGS